VNHKIRGHQNISKHCLVCGTDNPFGLKTIFYETTQNEVIARFTPRAVHQSYPGLTHGGITAAILDETIGRAIMAFNDQQAFGVTMELNVKYKKPVPYDVELKVVGRITQDKGRIFIGTGELYLPDGIVAATAEGRYLRRDLGQITAADFTENQWFLPPELLPEAIEI